MRILGIDLATEPKKTGVVVLAPDEGRTWSVRQPTGPADDDRLVELAAEADVIGMDVPLGWPQLFVSAVAAHQRGEPWPGSADRRALTHRRTDDAVRDLGDAPLSVAADKLGSAAMRGALLQHRWATEVWGKAAPRDGSGRLVETYPAAALRRWGLPHKRYKGRTDEARAVRRSIFGGLEAGVPWLDATPVRDLCLGSDHVLDGVVCVLAVVAQRAGASTAPPPADVACARAEGWIHVPTQDLGDLRPPA